MTVAEQTLEKPKRGYRLANAQRLVAIAKIADHLTQGYYTTNELSKLVGLSRKTIDYYRPLVDEMIAKNKLDRNIIRSLQIKRTYTIIEMLMKDLKTAVTIKDRTLLYNQIAKFSSHLALITGLNIETQVNVDHQQLVIIRADNNRRPVIDALNETDQGIEKAMELPIIKEASKANRTALNTKK